MVQVGLPGRLESKPGHENEVANLLTGAAPVIESLDILAANM